MAVNLINGDDTTITKAGNDIQINFNSSRKQELEELQNSVSDTGWIDIVTSVGTWEHLKCRKIGNIAVLNGSASSLQISGGSFNGGNVFASLPSNFVPTYEVRGFCTGTQGCHGRINIDTNGNLSIDAVSSTTTGGSFSGTGYMRMNVVFFLG